MNRDKGTGTRILGSLRATDGIGVVRVEDRLNADINDVWLALTDPLRLASWFADVDGDPRLGGEYRQRVLASGWEGTVRVEAYEPPLRLCLAQTPDGPDVSVTEVDITLSPDGEQTTLVIETRGMPLELLFAYGVGWQIHVEDLAAHLAGRERGDAEGRWDELEPIYRELATKMG